MHDARLPSTKNAFYGPATSAASNPLQRRDNQHSSRIPRATAPYGLRTTSGQPTSASVLIASTAQSMTNRP